MTGNWPEECEAGRRAAAALQDGFPPTFSSVGLSEQPASPERQRAVREPQMPVQSCGTPSGWAPPELLTRPACKRKGVVVGCNLIVEQLQAR